MGKVYRGQVWYYEKPIKSWKYTREDSLQGGNKPVIIISPDEQNEQNNECLVIPCTDKIRLVSETNFMFPLEGITYTAEALRIMCVAQENLKYKIRELDAVEMIVLEDCIKIATGFSVQQKECDISKERNEIIQKYSSMYSIKNIETFKSRLETLRDDANKAINAYNEQLKIHEDLLKIMPKVESKILRKEELSSRNQTGVYIKRTDEEKRNFVIEWKGCGTMSDKESVALKYGMSYKGAYSAFNRWNDKY